MSKIYRYKLDEEVISSLSAFGKLYEHLPNKEFKEQWKELLEINKVLFEKEELRLRKLGYEKDVYDKLYKSCRYYYRKKKPKEIKKRRHYINCSNKLLNAIDMFIKDKLRNNTIFKPSDYYELFKKQEHNIIEQEIFSLSSSLTKDEITNKIKKTFKNRCFILIKNNDNIYE